ncbi:MAG: glycosyltransferase, partial [Hyphococcus sp.]
MTSAIFRHSSEPLVLCDVTQSYSAKGGGVRTYLTEKRRYILENSDARHCLIVPGPEDKVTTEGRLTKIEIKSPQVPGSPNYRLLLRSGAVFEALKSVQPDAIECLDAYNLPWTALYYRRRFPKTVVVAGYHTDFPTVYVERYMEKRVGKAVARRIKKISYKYAANLYRRFDGFYTLTEIANAHFESMGLDDVRVLTLGADTDVFHPDKYSPALR